MKRWLCVGLLGALALLVALFFWRSEKSIVLPEGEVYPDRTTEVAAVSESVTEETAEPEPELVTVVAAFWELEPGDVILDEREPQLLRHYGSDTKSGQDDLRLVASVLQRFWLRFKDPDLLDVGSNASILESLSGRNPDQVAFVSKDNRFMDTSGQLLDRWGEALFFHPESMTRIVIRSSGPDRDRFTEDDILVLASTALRLK